MAEFNTKGESNQINLSLKPVRFRNHTGSARSEKRPTRRYLGNYFAFSSPPSTPLAQLVGWPGVLSNDTDPDGDSFTAALLTAPTKGTLTLNPHGSFDYVPNLKAMGVATFTYWANDETWSATSFLHSPDRQFSRIEVIAA